MMFTMRLLAVFSLITGCLACGTSRSIPKNGKFRTFYGDGSLQCVQFYKDGQRHGVWKCYYPSGGGYNNTGRRVQSIDNYRNGQLHGSTVAFNEKGDTLESGEYYKNRKCGSWRYFYPNGSIRRIEHLDTLSNPVGEQISYSPEMRVLYRELYTAPREGIVEYYDDTARITARYGIKNGLQHGTTCKYTYIPGTSDTFYREVSAYHMGNLHGWTIKYEGKTVVAKTFYNFGLKNDVAYYYDMKNGIEVWSPYVNNVLNGKQTESHNGQIFRETNYIGGVKNGEEYIFGSADGKVSERRIFHNGNADTTQYVRYPLLIWYTKELIDRRNNEYKITYRYNLTQDSLVYYERGGARNGKQITYHRNGNVAEEMHWKYGNADSVYILRNERGIIILKAFPCYSRDTLPELAWSNDGRRLMPGTADYEERMKLLPQTIQRFDPAAPIVFPTLLFRVSRETNGLDPTVISSGYPHWDKPGNVPSFLGGEQAREKYFQRNMRYPMMEFENEIEGIVYVEFTVTTGGSIDSVKVVKDVPGATGFSREVLRIVSGMPPWQPATRNGKPIAKKCIISVRFQLYGEYRIRRDNVH
jgi:TonB family protein